MGKDSAHGFTANINISGVLACRNELGVLSSYQDHDETSNLCLHRFYTKKNMGWSYTQEATHIYPTDWSTCACREGVAYTHVYGRGSLKYKGPAGF